MKSTRRLFIGALFALGAMFSAATPSFAQVLGRDYAPVAPALPTDNPGKIEVVEFFSYACPHCNEFHPLLAAWAAKQKGDVVLRKVPITFGRAAWANIAKLYYALQVTGDIQRLDGAVFKAIHEERVNLFDERAMKDWVVKQGVNPKKFADAYASFGVASLLRRGDQLGQEAHIQGVPSLVVDGKYLVGGRDFNDMLAITDQLVAKERSEKVGKK